MKKTTVRVVTAVVVIAVAYVASYLLLSRNGVIWVAETDLHESIDIFKFITPSPPEEGSELLAEDEYEGGSSVAMCIDRIMARIYFPCIWVDNVLGGKCHERFVGTMESYSYSSNMVGRYICYIEKRPGHVVQITRLVSDEGSNVCPGKESGSATDQRHSSSKKQPEK